MRHYPKRGEVWWADMGTGVCSEQRGARPVLVIQNDIGNIHSPTIIVAAITDGKKKHIPTHVQLGKKHGLPKDSVVMLEQIRTIDKRRLNRKVSMLDDLDMKDVVVALKISVGLAEVGIR
jgi:mRNA interferase MazF